MKRGPDGLIPNRLPFLQAICWQIEDTARSAVVGEWGSGGMGEQITDWVAL